MNRDIWTNGRHKHVLRHLPLASATLPMNRRQLHKLTESLPSSYAHHRTSWAALHSTTLSGNCNPPSPKSGYGVQETKRNENQVSFPSGFWLNTENPTIRFRKPQRCHHNPLILLLSLPDYHLKGASVTLSHKDRLHVHNREEMIASSFSRP